MAQNAANIERRLLLSDSEHAEAIDCSPYRSLDSEQSKILSADLAEEDGPADANLASSNPSDDQLPFIPGIISDTPDTQHIDKRARVEEVPDEDDDIEAGGLPCDPYTRYSPGGLAGATYGDGATFFDDYHEARMEAGLQEHPWAPFESEEEWELARWLLRSGLSQAEIDRYLKLDIVSEVPC